MRMQEKIEKKLTKSFNIHHLEVVDESYKHKGHTGAREGGESHFHVTIISSDFSGLSRVKRHKMVFELLKEEMKGSIHALSLTTLAPEEAA